MMSERNFDLSAVELTNFFATLAETAKMTAANQEFSGVLAQFFQELPTIPDNQVVLDSSPPTYFELSQLFAALQVPVEALKLKGGRLNLWEIAGLKRNEVRTAGALAGLWRADFGGATSRDFLGFYLERVIKDVDWGGELLGKYNVLTEVNPLGDTSDRVDLVIETAQYLIGIEIKINARLGDKQLTRYASALASRARHMQKSPILILLAPFSDPDSKVPASSWSDVSAAAKQATRCDLAEKTSIHHVITQFGDYVAQH